MQISTQLCLPCGNAQTSGHAQLGNTRCVDFLPDSRGESSLRCLVSARFNFFSASSLATRFAAAFTSSSMLASRVDERVAGLPASVRAHECNKTENTY